MTPRDLSYHNMMQPKWYITGSFLVGGSEYTRVAEVRASGRAIHCGYSALGETDTAVDANERIDEEV